jgi:hypothetical protein
MIATYDAQHTYSHTTTIAAQVSISYHILGESSMYRY